MIQSSGDFSLPEPEPEPPVKTDIDELETEPTSPPNVVDNVTISDGFEWVEWPEGSGQNHFRPEGTQEEIDKKLASLNTAPNDGSVKFQQQQPIYGMVCDKKYR